MTGGGNSFTRGVPAARRRARVRASRPVPAAIAAFLVVLSVTGVAWAALQDSHATKLTVSAGSVGSPSSVTATTSDECATISIDWTAGSNATSYAVEVKVGSGSWAVLNSRTGNVTTIDDTTGYDSTTVQYRVTSLLVGTSWYSAPTTSASLSC